MASTIWFDSQGLATVLSAGEKILAVPLLQVYGDIQMTIVNARSDRRRAIIFVSALPGEIFVEFIELFLGV